ncbi:MAG: hypothetical protein R3D98_02440 [Candidatus Krumholzibacteriia bacterium]
MTRSRPGSCVLLLAVALAASALAAPAKPVREIPPDVSDPNRQGGDTILDAVVIPGLPFADSGTTAGYTDDYDEACPYTQSTSPDVVYRYTAVNTVEPIRIDLCGSDYDTKVYVYDSSLNLVGCNDDFYDDDPCGHYVSMLDGITFLGGETYYIVIDGYGGDYGGYELQIDGYMIACYVELPDNEGEPPLVDGYVDTFNGGCESPPPHPVQTITGDADGHALVSGRTGWFAAGGSYGRDTDWFELTVGETGTIEIETCANYNSLVDEIAHQDCETWAVAQSVTSIYWVPEHLSITGHAPGTSVWVRVRPAYAEPPSYAPHTYGYDLWIDGLGWPVRVEARSWSAIKACFHEDAR